MPITQDRLINLLAVTKAVLSWAEETSNLLKNQSQIISELSNAQDPRSTVAEKDAALASAKARLFAITDRLRESPIPSGLLEAYIREKVRFDTTSRKPKPRPNAPNVNALNADEIFRRTIKSGLNHESRPDMFDRNGNLRPKEFWKELS
jgi:hypothetical protein